MFHQAALRSTLLAALLLASLASFSCTDGDDDGGPTGPPLPVPRISGVWSGLFSSDDSADSVVVFNLVQRGRDISGVVSVGAVAWSLRGEVDSRGIFRWQTESGTCGSFDGSTDVTTATHMVGRADLDRFFCPERERVRGVLVLDLENRR